jgi:hypothetical protein
MKAKRSLASNRDRHSESTSRQFPNFRLLCVKIDKEKRLMGAILPLLGRRKVPELTKSDLQRLLHQVSGGKTAIDERPRRGRAQVFSVRLSGPPPT